MKLNQAVSERLLQLLAERNMTQYQLYIKAVFGYGCGLLGGSVGVLFQKGKNGSAVKIISQPAGGNGPLWAV